MAIETKELAPLGVLTVLGILAGGGWLIVLGDEPEAPVDDTPAALEPASVPGGPTAHDEAMEAVARAGSQGAIRCAVPIESDESPAVDWPFEVAHYEKGLLRAVVPAAAGSRLFWLEGAANDPHGEPLGLLVWSGAEVGQVGGCEVQKTAPSRVEGTVLVDGQPAVDARVRVCGNLTHTDDEGRFSSDAWGGQRCIAWVSQSDLTHDFAPVVVPLDGVARVELETRRASDVAMDLPLPSRRVVVRRSLSKRALDATELSSDARSVLERWAEADYAANLERTTLDQQADALGVAPTERTESAESPEASDPSPADP